MSREKEDLSKRIKDSWEKNRKEDNKFVLVMKDK